MNFSINNYLIKYRTFDELLAEVKNDFKKYDANNMIDGSELIKVAQYINKSLGNKIRQGDDIVKEGLLYIDHGRAKLPSNFYKLDFASICYSYTTHTEFNAGRAYVEGCKKVLPPECSQVCPEPYNPCVRLNQCGEEYFIIEKTQTEIREYNEFGRLHILNGSAVSGTCVNTKIQSNVVGHIEKGYLYTNIDEAKVYIKYTGELEDEMGNLLVPDHELINPYYEYALKRRLLENLYMEDETVHNRLQLNEIRYKEAKVAAETFVNTPDFAEMQAVHNANRYATFKKYFKMFM